MIKLADTLAPMADFPAAMAEHVEFSDGKSLQEKYDLGELGGEGGGGHIELTQAEYDALSDEEKNNGAIYFITDAEGGEGGGASINDNDINLDSTWSSEKTVTEMLKSYDRYVRIKGISGGRNDYSIEITELDKAYKNPPYDLGYDWQITEVETSGGLLPSEILTELFGEIDDYCSNLISVGGTNSSFKDSMIHCNTSSGNTPFEVIFAGNIAKTQEDTKSYFTINILQNTKYVKIIPDNEQRHITIVSEDGECVEIFGDNDNGDQYIEECPKAVRLSYGAINSFNASEKTANIKKVLYNQTTGSKNFYVQCKSDLGYTIHGIKEQPQLVDGNSAEASQLLQQGLKEIPIISLIPEKDFYRVVAQDKAGYFKFKPSSDDGNEQPLRTTATDNYGGMIEISGNAPSQDQYKPFKCVRVSNGTYASYDAANTTNNKMKKLYLYDGYMYLQVETYTTVTFTGLIEAPTFVETLADTSTEIPIVSLVNPSIKAAAGSNINSVGTPSVTASESNGTTTFTFNYLKGAKGDTGANGTTPTIKAAAGSNINTVGTPSVTASTSGTTTTFTFNNLKGAKGDTGANGTTPTIKASAGSNIGSVGTPSVSASTSGTTTTFTFNYLKGAKGAKGATGATGASPLIHVNGMGGDERTMAELGPGEGILAICTQASGGFIFTSVTDGTVKCNALSFTKSIVAEAGKSYVICNTSDTATARIYCKNNGGCRWTIVGDVI